MGLAASILARPAPPVGEQSATLFTAMEWRPIRIHETSIQDYLSRCSNFWGGAYASPHLTFRQGTISLVYTVGTKPVSDDEIIQLLKSSIADQKRGLRLLYNGKAREFGRYFLRCQLSYEDAEEAVQETILKILKFAPTCSNDGSAQSWMWTIARNTMIDFKRRKKRNVEDTKEEYEWNAIIEGSTAGPTVGQLQTEKIDTSAFEVEWCVSAGVKKFAEQEPDRAYAISLHIEGYDGREIATRIGRTYEATRQYLLQCRQKLAPFISHCMQLIKA